MTQTKIIEIARNLKIYNLLLKTILFVVILAIGFTIATFNTENWTQLIAIGFVILTGIGIDFINRINKLK